MSEQAMRDFLGSFILPDWERLPDLGLYLDQVMGFIEKTVPRLDDSQLLTRSMINNYVKMKLVDPPVGKKYSRESMAQLLMIRELKQIFSIEIISMLLHPKDGADTHGIYEHFLEAQRQCCNGPRYSSDSSLQFALGAAACHALCRRALQLGKNEPVDENPGP